MTVISLIGFIFFLLFAYGIFAEKLNRISISGPMIFTTLGFLLTKFINIADLHINLESLEVIGQIALISILFTDASGISRKDFFNVYKWPVRLLLIGLPITMIIGTLTASLFFTHLSWAGLAILAFVLSPTDAALGQAVVNSPKIPERIRETINVESGLNDGLVLPPIIICLIILQGQADEMDRIDLVLYVSKQILLAPLVGIFMGWAGSKIINWSIKRRFTNKLFQGISIVAISVISYVFSEHIGGNGYIAAFMAGIFFSAQTEREKERGEEFGEFLSQPLALFVFFIFGTSIVPYYMMHITTNVVIYSLLSLTVLRMIPVIFSLKGTPLLMKQKVFISWFGPRGIASILYFLMIYKKIGMPEGFEGVYASITLTVVLSIFIHGLSAVPYSNYIGRDRSNSQIEKG